MDQPFAASLALPNSGLKQKHDVYECLVLYVSIVNLLNPFDIFSSRHKGMVIDFIEGTSTLIVKFDDGRAKTLELGKQAIRFISQKQKRSKT